MKILLFYFSGTGNTWWLINEFVSRAREDHHTVDLYSIEKITNDQWSSINKFWDNADLVGFGYPIYGSTAPKIMKEFLTTVTTVHRKDSTIEKSAFVLTTMELFSGDGALALRSYLKKANLSLVYAYNFQMVSNLGIPIITYNPVSEARFAKRRARTLKKLDKVYRELLAGRKRLQNLYNPLGYFLGWIQRVGMAPVERQSWKYFGVDETRCTQCQQCVNQCPTQAIIFEDDQFTFDPSCTACFRCYNFCPAQAITIAGRSANPKRHRQHQTYIKGDYY